MPGLAQDTKAALNMPNRSLGTLPSGAPTLESQAQGRVNVGNTVMVEVSGACTINIYLWSPTSGAWRLPGSASSQYQKVFTAGGIDYFTAPANAKFYIQAASGTVTGYTDAIPA